MTEENIVQTQFGPLPVDDWTMKQWAKYGWPDDDTLRQMVANGTIEALKPDVPPLLDPPLTLVRAVQTSVACPSQWDAWDADGNYYYLRYRSAYGRIERYETRGAFYDEELNRLGETIADFEYGHPLDGCIELAEFCELTGVTLAADADVTDFNQYLAKAILDALAEVDPEGAAEIRAKLAEDGEVEL
jgi:hypothetical protein